MNDDKNPVKKASVDPIKEAKGHPDGPGLEEMLNGEEEKVLKKSKKEDTQGGQADNAGIPVI